MKYYLSIVLILMLFVILEACDNKSQKAGAVDQTAPLQGIVFADTLVTDILIKSPGNDEWADYCLRNLDRKSFVDLIFELVYSGNLTPYDFFRNEPLTIEDIKDLEKSEQFSRNNIGKVQFEESWYYDTSQQAMVKKVLSVMLAYELYTSSGEIKGYKPAFKVTFNPAHYAK